MAPTRTGKIESLRSHYFPDPFSWAPTRRVRSGQPIRLAFGFAEGSLTLRLSSIQQTPWTSHSNFRFTDITSPPSDKAEGESAHGEAEGEPVWLFPLEPATAAEQKVDKKNSGSEATLFFPLFALLRWGPSAGGLALRGRLLLLTFLGEARKVSGCRAAPGAPSRPEKDRD